MIERACNSDVDSVVVAGWLACSQIDRASCYRADADSGSSGSSIDEGRAEAAAAGNETYAWAIDDSIDAGLPVRGSVV
jgi:hypothetical protein